MPRTLLQRVYSPNNLWSAWRKVRSSALQSDNLDIQNEALRFQEEEVSDINRINRQLYQGSFDFGEATGILKDRGSEKTPRPIVIPEMSARVVQRALLNVLQEIPAVMTYIKQEGSFGGIKELGVKNAIEAACRAIREGARYYIRSDIQGFFTKIPRLEVLKVIEELLPDTSMNSTLERGTYIELDNWAALRESSQFFPSYEIGVAQGSCLSPLMGNVLLHEFDLEMNQDDIICIRYIDDFLILGPDEGSVMAAFDKAVSLLTPFGMEPYKPYDEPEKAQMGLTDKMFDFLGCSISSSFVHPNRESRERILEKIRGVIEASTMRLYRDDFASQGASDYSLVSALAKVNNMLRAWTNHYSFCNDKVIMRALDEKVDKMLRKYLGVYSDHRKRVMDSAPRRRMLGVFLAQDGKRDPIYQRKAKR